MVWGILGALDTEVALICEKMQTERTESMFGTTFHVGTIAGQSVVVVCCGIGKVNAAACTTTMMQRFGADCIVNVGIAGAMAHGLQVLDVVAATEVGFHDQDAIMLKYYPSRAFFETDAALCKLCRDAYAALDFARPLTEGRIVSGDVFVSDRTTRDCINNTYHPACVEMEGASIGHVSFMHEKPFLVIRTMSDTADDEAAQTYDDFMDRAAHQSARIILKMLDLASTTA